MKKETMIKRINKNIKYLTEKQIKALCLVIESMVESDTLREKDIHQYTLVEEEMDRGDYITLEQLKEKVR